MTEDFEWNGHLGYCPLFTSMRQAAKYSPDEELFKRFVQFTLEHELEARSWERLAEGTQIVTLASTPRLTKSLFKFCTDD